MSHYFVTGAGTEIGKTYVTAGLTYAARQSHKSVMAMKPVVSGLIEGLAGSDPAILAEALGKKLSPAVLDTISPQRFQAALSAPMAAAEEGKRVDYNAILHQCRAAIAEFDTVFIEGAGGAYAPVAEAKLNMDLARDLGLPCLLVSGSYLGAQSHAIATCRALQADGLEVRAIIVSESADAPDLAESCAAISSHTGVQLLPLTRQENAQGWKHTPEFAEILKIL